MITLNLSREQVNAILVAVDSEIDYQFKSGKPDWEFYPALAATLMAYHATRCKFEEENCDG